MPFSVNGDNGAVPLYRCDQDGDGKLSREEFTNMMMKDHKN
jgi:Ca2+-binding EF-hand superfamily protein